jgi:hypothetical protein
MICAIVFGTAAVVGLGDDIVGIGIGAWALCILLFIIEARRASGTYDLGAAELASLGFIVATFLPIAWLDHVVRIASVTSVGLCEFQ